MAIYLSIGKCKDNCVFKKQFSRSLITAAFATAQVSDMAH